MAEPNAAGGEGTQAAAASKARQYGVFSEIEIDLTADPAAVVAQLQTAVGVFPVGHENAGQPLPKAVALIRVGRATETDPKKALNAVGEARDLDGDYETIADSARNKFANVKSAIKRIVEIG